MKSIFGVPQPIAYRISKNGDVEPLLEIQVDRYDRDYVRSNLVDYGFVVWHDPSNFERAQMHKFKNLTYYGAITVAKIDHQGQFIRFALEDVEENHQ
jgi:hypothetical protein